MYKVMIVEDEIPIRNLISKIIDWNQLGFNLVFEADNGQIAVDYLETDLVDLVITDISMPFMDGLELCRQIRKKHPSMTIIILTGYNEFEYAQQAVELNVSTYLLKPITKAGFTESLNKVKLEMDQRFEAQRDMAHLRKQFVKSKSLMLNKYLMNLVLGYSQTSISMNEAELGIDMEADAYRVAVMSIDDGSVSDAAFWGEDRPLLEFAIYNLTKEMLESVDQDIVFFGPGNQICAIVKSSESVDFLNELIIVLEDISDQIMKFFQIDATIGLSDVYEDVSGLSYAYEDAVAALEYQVLEGTEKVILKSNVENKTPFAFQKVESQLAKLEYHIKVGDLDSQRKVIHYIFSQIHYENVDINNFRTMLLKMILSIFKAINDVKHAEHDKQEVEYALFNKVFEMNDFDEIKAFYLSLCESFSNKIRKIRQNEEQSHVNEAIKYLKDHYDDPYLTLESLCKQLYLSPGHFSRLFKKTTGETFVDYLTRIRMDQAKILLANTSQKMYEISRAIGYEDPNYFSYNFKKNVDMTPSEWRKKG